MDAELAIELTGDIASQQWGLLTSVQAEFCGVDLPTLRRLEQRGVLFRVRHGVYASAGTPPSPELDIKAQWLAVRPEIMAADRTANLELDADSVVSHSTAADLWGVGDLWAEGIHFTVSKRRRTRQEEVHFHRAALEKRDWTIHPESGLPVTSVPRTVVDLAALGHEPDHLIGLIADAAHASLVTKDEMVTALAGSEEAFGLEKGDTHALGELLNPYFQSHWDAQTMRIAQDAMDQMLRPLREQIEELKLQQEEILKRAFGTVGTKLA